MIREHPTECRLLAIHFEETAKWEREENERQRREREQLKRNSGGGPNTNTGPGVWATEDEVGDDDEVDWYDA